jgi:phenylacetate-coenzyme A ligase PaaK-like adenylate-forming protein
MSVMGPWKNLTRLSSRQLRNLQSHKLQQFINIYLYPFSPHYRKLFDSHKLDPRQIKTVADLKHIPFTSKKDFISQGSRNDKFRDFVLQPDPETIRTYWPASKLIPLAATKLLRGAGYVQDRLGDEYRPIFMTFTTGTTHDPVPFVYTNYDIQNLYTSGSRMLDLFDIAPGERIVNMFPYAPHLAFWQVVFGGLASRVLILSTGGGKVMGTEGNIKSLLRMKPSVVLGVPSYVYHVLRTAREKGCKLDFVKKVVLGASKTTEVFKMRVAELLAEMGAKDVSVFGTYGFTEARSAWAECPVKSGTSSGYHLYPDKEIFEVVDPKTGDVKGEGEDGELVYTSLDARGSIVIRYRTGDFVKGGISYGPCPHCKRSVPRISSDITRLSDVKDLQLSKIKGALVNLNNFAAALDEVESVVEWQIELKKKDNDPYEVDEVVVYICPKEGANTETLQTDIKQKMLVTTEVAPNKIVFLHFHEIVKRLELETASKEKRILDLRPEG